MDIIEFIKDPVSLTCICVVVSIFFLLMKGMSNHSADGKSTHRNKHGSSSTGGGSDVSKSLQNEIRLTTEKGDSSRVLSASKFRQFQVIKVTKISHNTKSIRFEIPADKNLGLSIGRHITVLAEIDGNKVMRAYTPTSKIDQLGYFELLVKSYEYGKLSSYIHSLKSGSSLEVRGPVGRFKYTMNSYQTMGMIAGGTGITPCLQVISTILLCPDYQTNDPHTRFILFYQNRCEEDILLYEKLEELQLKFPQRLQIIYFLSNPSKTKSNNGSSSYGSKANEKIGYIQEEMIQQYLSYPDQVQFVGLCGPSGFNETMKKMCVAARHEIDKSLYIW